MHTIESKNVIDFAFTYKDVKVPVIWQFAWGHFEGSEAVVLGFNESDMGTGGLSLVLDVDGIKTRSHVAIDEDGILHSHIMKPSHYGEPVPFRYEA